ncbi:YihY/virulence factor BrkB family protein [Peptostreptococcus porci]|uniref:YihY/virulence factor BrkB family protein n=1 Tax=Peptostreptococcus porci TaxID=2652282 RepID=UPI0023F156BE|nr:YihY/virulence factor BrkB family protein [Peptostreptococcus porci]MDD7183048.1 YihY/virulence factor BrkB family protein [Peptostreptococcus porci]MDY5436089.1 YihY/virulence factor BrkB family protein [Peptostreptococcus porci]MDY6230981.1 YihY/virulence factor BrkB family protein [Peptostreptococcus porci]
MLDKMKKMVSSIKIFINFFNVPDMYTRSAETAFYLTISVFPSLIFLIAAMAYIPGINLVTSGEFLLQIIPDDAYMIINSLIESAVKNRSFALVILSFILATWTFSKAVKSVVKGQNIAYGFAELRGFVKLNTLCILFAIGFFLLTLLSIFLLVYGKKIGFLIEKIISDYFLLELIFNVVRFFIPVMYMIYIFTSLFTLGPSVRMKAKQGLPGACITTMLWIVFSILYSFYANNFSGINQIYGSISTMIVLMTWIYLCSMAITIGYKINSIIFLIQKKNSLQEAFKNSSHTPF